VFWADEIAASASGPQVVNDSKTPSGTVHVGSLRGPVIHDAIWRALRDRGVEARFLYGVDDLDPMDAQALLTPDAVERYMGVPLANVPAPEGSDAGSYARYFVGHQFFSTFEPLGIRPEFYWVSDLYRSGQMDPYIRAALDAADTIREIFARVANVRHPSEWHPLQVICESCGRVGTTIVTEWDGERVHYECRRDLVTWAAGCGNAGWITPFGGTAKLPWNVDWAAKWSLFGVTIEGCGKDLATRGGSRDRSDAIAREVFQREPPLNVTYEFLNVGGRKMSTSRGTGAAAHEIAEVLPPEQLRFLFLRSRPKVAIEFDPDGTDAIPRLFDESDRIAAAVAGREVRGELPPDHERLFALTRVDASADPRTDAQAHRPAFAHLAMLEQIPGVDVAGRVAAEKGGPLTDRERALLDERRGAARAWLARYAPERARLAVQREALPAAARDLDDAQRAYLGDLAGTVDASSWDGEAIQAAIFATAKVHDLPSGRAFAALYAAFLGRTSGPRAGWLLAALDREFVVGRLREAARPVEAPA
jgi:lysyl-tRNA synthetase class 1